MISLYKFFNLFDVEDNVWHPRYGDGVVNKVNYTHEFEEPLYHVNFEKHMMSCLESKLKARM